MSMERIVDLVRRKRIPGSRRDHYEAATDFFRAMQEIFERRFRWTVRQAVNSFLVIHRGGQLTQLVV